MKIDLLSPQSFAHGHPFEQYRWLRDQAPVYWHEEPNGPGFWALTRFADVHDVDRNHTAFSSEPTIMIQDPPPEQQAQFGPYKMMLMMDPPQHTAYRKLIRGAFTHDSADALGPRMTQLATEIVDKVIESGACDFVSDVAGEFERGDVARGEIETRQLGRRGGEHAPLDVGRELELPLHLARLAFRLDELGAGDGRGDLLDDGLDERLLRGLEVHGAARAQAHDAELLALEGEAEGVDTLEAVGGDGAEDGIGDGARVRLRWREPLSPALPPRGRG